MSIDVDSEGVVAFAQELVRIESVNDPSSGLSEAPAAAAVATKMRSFGWEPVVEEVVPGRPNVICRVDGGLPGRTLMFEGHTDVVTAGDRSAWERDPFSGDIEFGRLFGRGSADMKSGLAAVIYATRALELAGPFSGAIVIGALCDEEEMMIGVKHFVEQGHCESIDAVISAEPEGGEICAVSKGAIRIRIDAVGRMAHGAMPFKGANPVAALAAVAVRLGDLQTAMQRDFGEYQHLGHVWLTPTMIHGGSIEQLNVIPAEAVMTVDVRTTPAVDHGDLLDRVSVVLSDIGTESGVELTPTIIDDRPSTDTPTSSPVCSALAAAHVSVTGEPPVYGGVPGSTDGTILWRDGGLDSVVYGPGDKWIAHQVDEYVDVEEIVTYTRVYARAALNFLTEVA
jgi:succinyl-diaminopimelate desuccinylase